MKPVLTPAVCLLAVTSWALTFADYPWKSAKECAVSGASFGIVIGADALESSKAQETYFHTQLAEKGFLPVFVVIENTRADSVIFDKEKVNCSVANSVLSAPHTGAGMGLVGLVEAVQMTSEALTAGVRRNLLQKEMQSTTLSPGASARGFLYLQIPKKAARGKIMLRIPITKAGTGDSFDVNLVL